MGVPALFLDLFLSTHASSVQAMLSSANGPLVTAQILLMLPLLRVIVTTSAGLHHVDLLECRRRGIAVAHAGKVFSEDVADMAVGDVLRKISAADRLSVRRQASWKEKPNVSYPFHSNIHELAAGSDVFVICCALNEQTHHMLNKEVILALGKEGVIVNVRCGAIVDEKEIVKCLLHERVEVLVLTCTKMNLMFLKSSVELIMFCCQPI
ncbi:hypothetical protein FEM48_Zijuj12G0129900 [Ziziphus jujuba var. spinosa]|uniref:D-isomer specific 2-hydroxyacid dehydrogenase NAD-binding domain-containing protein n=1 Tax=Ziziphus jujuba var. spinosa TaxID=714518 RepID=A0A978UDH1_ZIZJJ|nr:hypothetical protein FEM48_Zijuj12G0129900 [Ziziphus jujuba var. spinosa]